MLSCGIFAKRLEALAFAFRASAYRSLAQAHISRIAAAWLKVPPWVEHGANIFSAYEDGMKKF
jgi:hypothetical protein